MQDELLERILATNDELAALDMAGVPISLGDAGHSVSDKLKQIDALVTRRVGRGESAIDALSCEEKIPALYSAAMRSSLASDAPVAVFHCVASPAERMERFRSSLKQLLLQPALVFLFACLAFGFTCILVAPHMESIYEQLYREPSQSLAFLRDARHAMPVWGGLIGLLVVGLLVFWRRTTRLFATRSRFGRWMPGKKGFLVSTQYAHFADQLALLLERGVSLPQGLSLAADTTANAEIRAASSWLANAQEANEAVAAESAELKKLPSLLRWVLTSELTEESLPEILRFASETYRSQAKRYEVLRQIALPAILSALLGGVIVFAYGLSLFFPFIRLLQDLSAPEVY